MQLYSESTPVIRLTDNTIALDLLNSGYVNLRYGATLETVITIDSRYEANLPGLAFDYYGNQEMWRVIMEFNGIQDPLNEVLVGVLIRMPSQASVDAFFTKTSTDLNPTLVL